MTKTVDVFVTSLPKVADAIKQSEYVRGGRITTTLGQVATQLECKNEVFISGILDNTCFQLYQTTRLYNVPPNVVDEFNTKIAGYVTDLIEAYTNQEPVYETLRDILYTITRVGLMVSQTYTPRQGLKEAESE